MLSLVHMAGDAELIRGRLKPAGLFLNEVQGFMTEEDKAEVRALALDVIRDYRDRGCPEPDAGLRRAAARDDGRGSSARTVPDEYVPMLLEEMELDGADAAPGRRAPTERGRARRSPSWSSAAASRACSPASG